MDLRNDKAKARDTWMESPEGQGCIEGSAQGQYLKNRVENAFCTGWDAAETNLLRFRELKYVDFVQRYKHENDCEPDGLALWNAGTLFMENMLKKGQIPECPLLDKVSEDKYQCRHGLVMIDRKDTNHKHCTKCNKDNRKFFPKVNEWLCILCDVAYGGYYEG